MNIVISIGGNIMFNHIPIRKPLPNLKRKNEDHKRVYYDDEGNRYHSVTNVVGSIDQTGLEEWRKAVGEDVANYVSRKAMNLGTKLHTMVETYLYNKKNSEKSIFAKAHFENIKPLLQSINNIRGLESKICSKDLGLAGTADCIAEYNGVLSIIDFKTSSKQKKEEWILKYFLQTTAYSIMWEEATGEKVDQIVVLITAEDGSREEYIRNKQDYIQELHNVIESFNNATV
jgi:genome maintenance exonuclease 1